MIYLLDTNIWLERLLDQEKSEEVALFLSQVPAEHILMSDFSLHSIGVIFGKFNRTDTFIEFVDDVFVNGGVNLVTVLPGSMHRIVAVINQFNLDFDDAYQYVAAEQNEAVLISFDSDFNRTDMGRTVPSDILLEPD